MRVLLLNLGFIHQKNLSAFRAMCKYTSATLIESSKVEEVVGMEWDLVWIPFGYIPPRKFSEKTKRIILGPHNFVLPEPPWTTVVFQDNRASYNCLSRWNRDAYIKAGGVADLSLVCLPFPVDTDTFTPSPLSAKTHDCFVYTKLRDKSTVLHALKQLDYLGFSYKVVRYGEYTESEFKTILDTCRFGVWLGRHESQGFALQEALSCNIPLVVWNVESMGEEWDIRNDTPVYRGVRADVKATSVPYWDARCGITVDRYTLTEGLRFMKLNWPVYRPREFVLQQLSVAACCEIWGIKQL